MKSCSQLSKIFSVLLCIGVGLGGQQQQVVAFTTTAAPQKTSFIMRKALPEKVEVCGFKDCRRAGGGARLENLIKTVLEENNLADSIKVESCECQGECGYGPNLVVDGKMVNRVKGKDAVAKALNIPVEAEAEA